MSRPTLDDRELRDALAHIARLPDGPERSGAVTKFVDGIAKSGVLRSWAEVFVRSSATTTSTSMSIEEVEQIAALRLLERVRAVTVEELARVEKPSGWLFWKCREAVRDTSLRGGYTPLSGMGAALRRQAHLRRTREAARNELGREPTDLELLERANAKYGPGTLLHLTADDLAGPPSMAPLPEHDRAEELGAMPGPDADTSPNRDVLVVVVARAPAQLRQALWRWGEVWLELASCGARPTGAEVALQTGDLGISPSSLARAWNLALAEAADDIRGVLDAA